MNYLFTSESVSEGHPDKVADQISDALLDEFLAYDPNSKVACETLVTTGQVILAGEVKSQTYVDVAEVARNVIAKIGYTKSEYRFEAQSCGVFSSIHEQSDDINRGVEQKADPMEQGAGDQGMMFGYATNETENFMPLPLDLSHALLQELAYIRKNELHLMPYLRPDAKSQVTIEYSEDGTPLRIDTIVISTQHDEFILPENNSPEASDKADKAMQDKIREDIINILIPRVREKYQFKKIFINFLRAISNIISIQRANLLSVVLTEIRDLRAEKSSLTPTEEKLRTAEARFRGKTPPKLIVRQRMQLVISPKIWLPPAWLPKFLFKFLMLLASPNR